MTSITLNEINDNILAIKGELDEIKDYLEEDNMELSAETIMKIEESRKRPLSEMISQKKIEEKFL